MCSLLSLGARPARGQTALLATLIVCLFALGTAGIASPADVVTGRPASPDNTSRSCATCHAQVYAAWAGTDHALANRTPTSEHRGALKEFPRASELGNETPKQELLVIGHAPTWQPLVPAPGGRWQAHELAYDPAHKEWFNVFGSENRRPGEWGHWTGRGMNWNTMCAPCHMTGYQAGYASSTDSFASTWTEHGVGCVGCHGEPPAGHGATAGASSLKPYATFAGDRSRAMQTCAPCHARNEPLTASFKPGEIYHDHYRVTLPSATGAFYADGQQRDEVFNWTSVLASRMGHAGVTCLDCHDPHTTKTILPARDNALCMQCHSAPGRVMPGGVRAIVIEPSAHSRHAEGSEGDQCVACHMPTTNYMQRSPRHDHGWIKPDPLLTRELGIPNACSKCHEKEGLAWVIEKAEGWYGARLDSRQRARTRAIAGLQAGSPDSVAPALAALAAEDVPAWRASLLDLLAPFATEPSVRAKLEEGLRASDPLERAAAVRGLAPLPDSRALIRRRLEDPVRLVRLEAAWALSAELPTEAPVRAEFDAYLRLGLDQPSGLARLGADLANRGHLDEARQTVERASRWDSGNSDLHLVIARLLLAQGKTAEAAERYLQAAENRPNDAASAYDAALAFAEAGRDQDAEKAFSLCLRREPSRHRAWYNLGLLLARQERLPEALAALARAEKLAPSVADYPYAAATVHMRLGDRTAAQEAASRARSLRSSAAP